MGYINIYTNSKDYKNKYKQVRLSALQDWFV